jgi:hypothetical protein
MFISAGSIDHSNCCSLLGNSQGFDALQFGFDSLPSAGFVLMGITMVSVASSASSSSSSSLSSS